MLKACRNIRRHRSLLEIAAALNQRLGWSGMERSIDCGGWRRPGWKTGRSFAVTRVTEDGRERVLEGMADARWAADIQPPESMHEGVKHRN
jgi:hypothetical protein